MVFDTHEFKVGTAYAVLFFCAAAVIILGYLTIHLIHHACKQVRVKKKDSFISPVRPNKRLFWILLNTIICIVFFIFSILFIMSVVIQYILIDGHKLHDQDWIDHLYYAAFEELEYMIAVCDCLGHIAMISVFIARFQYCFKSQLFGYSLNLIRFMEICLILLLMFVIVIISLIIVTPDDYVTIITLEIIWEVLIEILCIWMMYLFVSKLYSILLMTFNKNQFHRDMARAVNPIVQKKKDEQSSSGGNHHASGGNVTKGSKGSGSKGSKDSKGSKKGSKSSKKSSKVSKNSKDSSKNKFWHKNKSSSNRASANNIQDRNEETKQTLQMTIDGKLVDRYTPSPSPQQSPNQTPKHTPQHSPNQTPSPNPPVPKHSPNPPISPVPLVDSPNQTPKQTPKTSPNHSPHASPNQSVADVVPKGMDGLSLEIIEDGKEEKLAIEPYPYHVDPEYTVTQTQPSGGSNTNTPRHVHMKRQRENKDTSDLVNVITKMTLLIVVVTSCSVFTITGNIFIELHEMKTIPEHDVDIESMYVFLLPVTDMIITSFMLYLQFNFADHAYSVICGKLDLFFLTLWIKFVRQSWRAKLKEIGTETYKKRKNTENMLTISESTKKNGKYSTDASVTINVSSSDGKKQIEIPTIKPNKDDWNKNTVKMTVKTKSKTSIQVILH